MSLQFGMSLLPWVLSGMVAAAATLWVRLSVVDTEPVASVRPGKGGVCEMLWQKWSPGLVERERAHGRAVWLHFSADWDLLSKLNEKRIFEDQEVMRKLVDTGVAFIWADLTERDPEVEAELKRYGRVTVPTDLLFPGDPDRPMITLSEVISKEEALRALTQATR